VLEKLLDLLRSIPAPVAIAAAFLLPAAETALMAGLLIPGELIAVAAGLLAARGHVPVIAVAAAAAAGAIVGDSIGFLVGRHFRRVITRKLHARRWSKAKNFLERRGKPAIFLARFTAFVRSVMPPAAGSARIPYGTFLLWSVPAGILWGVGSVLLGYYAGRSSEAVLRWVGIGALALIAGFAGYWWLTRKKRRRSRARPAHAASR